MSRKAGELGDVFPRPVEGQYLSGIESFHLADPHKSFAEAMFFPEY